MDRHTLKAGYKVLVSNQVGCESTELEGNRVVHYLALNGHTLTESLEQADYVIVNTCAFLQTHRKRLIRNLESFSGESRARVIVMGCAREIAPGILEPHQIALACGHSDLDRLDSIFYQFVPFQHTPPYQWSKNFARLVLSTGRGCTFSCSFCSIKKSIGFIKSRSIREIITDLEINLASNRRQFLLAADDLGSFGKDCGATLPMLLDEIERIEGDFTVLLSNIHPTWFLKYFDAIQHFLVSRHSSKWLFLPIQSGSQAVLTSMRRYYSVQKISDKLSELVRHIPDLRFYFDVIVGYPTESEDDFNQTLGFISKHPPSCLMTAPFSAEEATLASQLTPVDDTTIRSRVEWLNTVHRMAIHRENRVPMAPWGDD